MLQFYKDNDEITFNWSSSIKIEYYLMFYGGSLSSSFKLEPDPRIS